MFAIVTISGKQYFVSKGDVIDVDRIETKAGEELIFDSVLLIVGEDKKVTLGKPVIKGAKVVTKVIEEIKGTKLRVSRYKSKVRYRKTIGFRPKFTRLEIIAIEK